MRQALFFKIFCFFRCATIIPYIVILSIPKIYILWFWEFYSFGNSLHFNQKTFCFLLILTLDFSESKIKRGRFFCPLFISHKIMSKSSTFSPLEDTEKYFFHFSIIFFRILFICSHLKYIIVVNNTREISDVNTQKHKKGLFHSLGNG